MKVINRAARRYPALSDFIQVGGNRFMAPDEMVRRGLSRYVPPTGSAPQRTAAMAVLKSAAPAPRGAVSVKPPSTSLARNVPADIPAAMAAGLSNPEINGLISKGLLRRPRSLAHAELWPVGAWRAAEQRGLVW